MSINHNECERVKLFVSLFFLFDFFLGGGGGETLAAYALQVGVYFGITVIHPVANIDI